jgi:hypothetical protein
LALSEPSIAFAILRQYGGWHQHQRYCKDHSKQNTDDSQIVTSVLGFTHKRFDHPLYQLILQG